MPARNHSPGRGQAEDRKAGGTEGEPGDQRATLAQARDRRPDQCALHDHGAYTDQCHREADRALVPAVTGHQVEDVDARQAGVGDVHEEVDAGEPQQLRLRAQQRERAERIGAPPREGGAALGRQRFRQHQQSVERIGETEHSGDPERQARIDAAGEAAERGAEHEAHPEGDTQQTEARRALLGRRDVGHIGVGGGDARRGDAGDHAPDEQPPQVWRERHQDVVEPEPEIGEQDQRPAPEAVGQHAMQRREQELHQRRDRAEDAIDLGRARIVAGEEVDHQLGQDGHDDAQRQHVEQHRDEHENEGGAPWRDGL